MNLISWSAHLWTQFPGVRFRHPPVATILYLHDGHHYDGDRDQENDDYDDAYDDDDHTYMYIIKLKASL